MTTTDHAKRKSALITFGVLAYLIVFTLAYSLRWAIFAIVITLVGASLIIRMLWKSQRQRQERVEESLARFGSSVIHCSPTTFGWIAAGEDWIGVSSTFSGVQRVPLIPGMPFLSGVGVKQYYRRGDVSLPEELREQFRNKPWLYIPNPDEPFQSILALFRNEAELQSWLALLSDDLKTKFANAKPTRQSPTQWQKFLKAQGADFLIACIIVILFAIQVIVDQLTHLKFSQWLSLIFGVLNLALVLPSASSGVGALTIQRFWLWVGSGDIQTDMQHSLPIAQGHVVGICDIGNQSQVVVAPISSIQDITVEPHKPSFFVRDLFHPNKSESGLMRVRITFKNQPDLKLSFLLETQTAQRFVELLKQSSDL